MVRQDFLEFNFGRIWHREIYNKIKDTPVFIEYSLSLPRGHVLYRNSLL